MSMDLEKALDAIASDIAPDVAEFTPSDEQHLYGWDDLLLLGGSFLSGFLGGFAEAGGKETGKLAGEALIDYIAKKIKQMRSKTSDEQTASLKSEVAEAEKSALTPEMTAAIAAIVEKALASALAKEAEPDIAGRVAAQVRQQALKVLAS